MQVLLVQNDGHVSPVAQRLQTSADLERRNLGFKVLPQIFWHSVRMAARIPYPIEFKSVLDDSLGSAAMKPSDFHILDGKRNVPKSPF